MKRLQDERWQREESRVYLRDILFLLIISTVSMLIAEKFTVAEEATLTDRILAYILIFIPLVTINFIAHYIYRNRRIKSTGSLRSSLRYRIILAYLIVIMIPSIPIFLISSNTIEKAFTSIFDFDIKGGFESGQKLVENIERMQAERLAFLADTGLYEIKNGNDRQYHSVALAAKSGTEIEDFWTEMDIAREDFNSMDDWNHTMYRVFINRGRPFIVVFHQKPGQRALILADELVPDNIQDYNTFQHVHNRIQASERGFQEEIPYSVRTILVGIYGIMIILAFIMSIFLARQLSFPIVSLAAATREVTDGNLDTRIDLQAQGEMGILIDSFNQMTAELQSLRTRLLQSQRMAAWREVARRLAHEIKNPLTPIQLSADRMLRRLNQPEKGNLEKIVQESASTIRQQVQILKQMVEEFANFARMPRARPVMQNLNAIVQEAASLYDSTGVTIKKSLKENLPDIALDKNIIVGMVQNLMKNSIEAMKETRSFENESKPDEISITTDFQRIGRREFVVLKVGDSGPGITEEMKEKIFEPYYSTKGEHGSGLGLSMVERAALEHNARIQIGKSQAGGAEFRILFPANSRETERKNLAQSF